MASGPSIHGNYISEGHNLGSDDVFCSYDDYTNEGSSCATHIDSSKDFHISRMAKTSTFPATVINSPEGSLSQDVIATTVEKSMKACTANLMRFLEGISSRLSQLELYCYNLDKSIGEMRSELTSDHEEADLKLKSLDKHMQEVHRSLQILRDKQELVETQKELAVLQLARKGSHSSIHSQSNEEKFSSPASIEQKRTDNASRTSPDPHNQQLALALSHQVAYQQPPIPPSSRASSPNVTQTTQQPPYYMLPAPSPNPPVTSQLPQNQYFPTDPQYRYHHPPTSSQVTQSLTAQQFSQYQQQPQQQWPQQLPQQVQPLQPPSMNSQMRPPSVNAYAPYLTSQASSPLPTDTLPNSMPIQKPYSGIPTQIKGHYPSQPGNPYGTSGVHNTPPPASAYVMHESEGGRVNYPPQPSQSAQGVYPPQSASVQNPALQNLPVRNPSQPQLVRSHPYNELIENLVSMGVRGDLVVSIIQRLEETGQPVNFNSVLDRLNVHSSLGPQRGWSG
ncbi:mediator of RNA polymerase II transcription subunit 15-like [Trifolium pratense]|uniref:mediator of RNA polymerase II transcription subunit 15-like n=1 Tax=Trifolium pratense TaxID=57577 RepID=UPI001E692119|nr:mediator of RNA polymerase II transcription subunit 15-like [Trifolium pratense]